MSTRPSGFDRRPSDLYPTPAWVIDALAEHVNLAPLSIWEPACGAGHMAQAIEAHGAHVTATDVNEYGFEGQADAFDFLGEIPGPSSFYFDAIVTNPPYGQQGRLAEAFIGRGLERIPQGGLLALLLAVDFDSGSTRARFFADCPDFAAKIVLRRRIEWFPRAVRADGSKAAGPSANHAWFIWERSHVRRGPAVTLYAPSEPVEKINTEAA